jgi:type II secretory pathway predicted ATPase ExeA
VQPPSSAESLNDPLYEAFYGLREQPFSLTTDPRFLYLSASHRQAFDDLLTGLRRREGLLLLTGDTGTGKTTLCRAVIDALGHRTFAALVLNPYMNDAEVLRTILRDFGLVTREDIRKGAFERADVPQLLDTLDGFLRSLLPLNSYAVVIIDEAQSLSARVLDQIRVLGSMEQDGKRLIQIVLVGQPALIETLRSDPMRALADRISRRATLTPLTPADVEGYIRHRLTIAGGKDAVTFDAEAIARIADLSDGLPRRINLLCDRALEQGRVAGVTTITSPLITRAARSIAGAKAAALEAAPPAPPTPAGQGAPSSEDRPSLSDLDLDQLDTGAAREDVGDRAFDRETEVPFNFAAADEPEPTRSKWWVLVVILAVLVSVGAAGGYFAYRLVNETVATPHVMPPKVVLPQKLVMLPAPADALTIPEVKSPE